uniref:Uncharacterized protein n=1 Tax=Anguilla anguilla TaxID=7936 RepID=A0A0E9PE32_ANGAN
MRRGKPGPLLQFWLKLSKKKGFWLPTEAGFLSSAASAAPTSSTSTASTA